jgi:hypothetical protein
MARSTMAWLIEFLRTKINDTDEVIWMDDQLQNYLDIHRVHIRRELLIQDATGKLYYSKFGMLEDDVKIWDSPYGNAMEITSSEYTANLMDGYFVFNEEQNNNYYLDGKSYNVYCAIAECLEELAMDQNKSREWSRGEVKYKHYDLLEMARYHRSLGGSNNLTAVRTYTNE